MYTLLIAATLLVQDPSPPELASRGTLRHPSTVAAVAVSADSTTAFAGLDDGRLLAWSLADRKLAVHGFREFTGLRDLSVSRDGSLLAVATQGGPFHLLEAATLKPVKEFHPGWGQTRVVMAPDGKSAFVALMNGHLLRVKIPDLTVEKDFFPTDKSLVIALACSPDGRWVATSDRDGMIKLWTADTLDPVRSWKAHDSYARSLAFHASKSLLASGGEDHGLKIWNAEDGTPVFESKDVHHESVRGLAFAPDGTLVSGGQDGLCQFWDADPIKAGRSLPNYRGFISSVAVSPDGKWLVRGGSSFDVVPRDRPEAFERVAAFGGSIQGFDATPDRRTMISVSLDRTATIWTVSDQISSQTATLDDWGTAAAFSRDGKHAAVGLGGGMIDVYEVAGLKRIARWEAHRGRVGVLAATAAGWASGGDDGRIRLWSAAGEPAGEFPADGAVRSLDAHGARLAAGTSGGEVVLCDADAKSILRRARLRPLSVTALRFSRDGSRLACGYFDGAVEVLDPEKLTSTASRKGDGSSALAIDFSSKGDWISAGFRDGVLRILDTLTLEAAITRSLDSGREIFGIRFVLDDTTFAAAGADHALTFWALKGDVDAWRAKNAGPKESTWKGTWKGSGGFVFDFVLDLKIDGAKAAGKFTWTLTVCPESRDDLKGRVGASGTEEFEGTWNAATRTLEVTGLKVSDGTLLATDSYRLKLAASGDAFEGNSCGNDKKWESKLTATKTGGRSPGP